MTIDDIQAEQNYEEYRDDGRELSDSQKIVRRHLENKDDIISHEDIQNVRIGVRPSDANSKDPNAQEEQKVQQLSEEDTSKEDDKKSKDEPITPWDTISG